MAADQAILREYLVALGFKVNETEHKKFDGQVKKTDARMFALGKTAVGVATSIVTFTTLFAKSMERLYYSSRYANTTAGNLKALEFGAQQIGLKAGAATAGVTSMVAAIRANPGLLGLLTGKFGIQVAGRESTAVFNDLIRVLRAMPPYIGQQFAAMFGISPEDLFNLGLGLEKMEKAQELQKQMADEMGVDMDAAARMGVEYSNTWREVTTHAGLLVALIGMKLMPKMQELAGVTHDVMNDWARIVKDIDKNGGEGFAKRLAEGLGVSDVGGGVELSEGAKARLGVPKKDDANWFQKFVRWNWDLKGPDQHPTATDPAAVDAAQSGPIRYSGGDRPRGNQDRLARLRELEQKYALPEGVLDKMWKQESGRGASMLSPKGAKGHFGFMDATAKDYGLNDPNDFESSADAAARLLRDRLKARGGDLRTALADYNWGPGNVNRYGLGRAPKETRDYMDTVAGPASITQETTIHIPGAEKPREAADAVATVMDSINAEATRNFIPKVR